MVGYWLGKWGNDILGETACRGNHLANGGLGDSEAVNATGPLTPPGGITPPDWIAPPSVQQVLGVTADVIRRDLRCMHAGTSLASAN